jgi:hypothetical protein
MVLSRSTFHRHRRRQLPKHQRKKPMTEQSTNELQTLRLSLGLLLQLQKKVHSHHLMPLPWLRQSRHPPSQYTYHL